MTRFGLLNSGLLSMIVGLALPLQVLGQCPITITATANPAIVCEPATFSTLTAQVSGGVPYQIEWSPDILVTPVFGPTTTAFITQTTTFTVTARSASGVNLIQNGDFSQGNTGFTSAYTYLPPAGPLTLYPEGAYTIAADPSDVHDQWASCGDHTGGGDMLIVNGSATPNQNVWCQTVPVMADTDYAFEAWLASSSPNSPAQLQFSINGTLLGNIFNASAATCVWQQFVEEWNSGGSTSAEICIVNQNTSPNGNDFMLDDLVFNEICEATTQVTVELQLTDPSWVPQNFCGDDAPVVLDDLLSPTATPGGYWTINNVVNSVFDPAVVGPGIHTVTYFVGTPPCEMMETHDIFVDVAGDPAWTPPSGLCLSAMPELLNNWLDPGTDPSGYWTINNQITTIFDAVVLGAGTHTISYILGAPPCETSSTQMITIDSLPNPLWHSPGIQCPDLDPFPLADLFDASADMSGVWRVNGDTTDVFNPLVLGPGNHSVSYTVGSPPCNAELTQNILVVSELDAVVPTCAFVTENSVIFGWEGLPGVQNYEVELIDGPMGQLNGLFYIVMGMQPNQSVTIRVRAIGPGGCPGPWSEIVTCTAGNCPPLDLQLAGVDLLCVGSDPIQLTVNDSLSGTGFYAGPGIADSTVALFDPALTSLDTNRVFYYYSDGSCEYSDSLDIVLLPAPVAAIDGTNVLCMGDTATLDVMGTFSANDTLTWDFGAGQLLSGTGTGPLLLEWPVSGPDTVTLTVSNGVCDPVVVQHLVQVNASPAVPLIECQASATSVTFVWNDVSFAADYQIVVLAGPSGQVVDDTTYVVNGLLPGETVTIELTTNSINMCPGNAQTFSCTATECPSVALLLTGPTELCANDAPVTLSVNDTLSGTGTFSGAGISDPIAGIFDPMLAVQDTNLITYNYTQGGCNYADSISIVVVTEPVATLDGPSVLCIDETGQFTFTGQVPNDAIVSWDFGAGTVLGDPTVEPLSVVWSTSGVDTVRVTVDNGICAPVTTAWPIQIDAPPATPTVSCNSDLTSVTFSWNAVDHAADYTVIVNSGQSGQLLDDTTFVVTGLSPDEAVAITLATNSNNVCPGNTQEVSCAAASCPPLSLAIAPPAAFCTGTDTLQLAASLDGLPQVDSVVWDGPGILDSATGRWWPAPDMAGTTVAITATYTLAGVCFYTDTIMVAVPAIPVATLDLPLTTCVETNITASSMSAADTYYWLPGVATVNGPTDGNTLDLSWSVPGMYTVGLGISQNGCPSDTVFSTITVAASPDTVVVNCTSGLDGVTFTWTPPTSFSSFTVNVLSGPTGTLIDDMTYEVTGLQPEQSVTIELLYFGAPECPPSSTIFTCAAEPCTDVTLAIDPVDTVCIGDAALDLVLTATVTGDTSPGTLVWSGPAGLDPVTGAWSIDPVQAGQTVPVYLTYTEGVCQTIDSTEVIISAQAVAAFIAPTMICLSDTVTLNVGGTVPSGTTYVWDFGGPITLLTATDVSPVQLLYEQAGVYTISLTLDAPGCPDGPVTQMVSVSAPLIEPTVDCTADYTGVIFGWDDVTGATDYQIDWNGNYTEQPQNNTVTLDGIAPGTEITGSLQIASDGVCPDLTIPLACATLPCPEVNPVWVAPAALCEGEAYEITLVWDDSEVQTLLLFGTLNGMPWQVTASSGLPVLAGTLTETLEIAIDSVQWSSVTACSQPVPPALTLTAVPPVEAGTALPFSPLCADVETIVTLSDYLQGANSGGSWMQVSGPAPQPGTLDLMTGTLQLGTQTAGTYVFRYSLSGQGTCPDDAVDISIELYAVPIADAGPEQILGCFSNIISLGASGTSSGPTIVYNWTALGGTPIADANMAMIDVSSPDTYRLLVTDTATGCSAVDQVQVTNDDSTVAVMASAQPISCAGANDGIIMVETISGGEAPYTIHINGTLAGELITNLSAGNYTVTVTDSRGCIAETSVVITEPAPVQLHLTPNPDTTIQFGEAVQLSALTNLSATEIDTVIWQPDTLACANCLTQTYAPAQTTTVSVTIIDNNGCSETDMLAIFVDRRVRVYVPNSFSPNGDGNNDLWTVFAAEEVRQINEVRIFDRWGEQVFMKTGFSPNFPDEGWDGSFRGQALPPAVYVYWLEVELIDGTIELLKGDLVLLR